MIWTPVGVYYIKSINFNKFEFFFWRSASKAILFGGQVKNRAGDKKIREPRLASKPGSWFIRPAAGYQLIWIEKSMRYAVHAMNLFRARHLFEGLKSVWLENSLASKTDKRSGSALDDVCLTFAYKKLANLKTHWWSQSVKLFVWKGFLLGNFLEVSQNLPSVFFFFGEREREREREVRILALGSNFEL